ncbi:MAG TPA: hypothetical protein VEC12_04900 [Bacteroidia bacterium]|nr:hypothetical protein [Bacteroidia bacterium]
MRFIVIKLILLFLPFSLVAQKYQLTFEQKANYSVYNLQAPFPYRGPYGPYSKIRLGFESEVRVYYTPAKKLSYYLGVGFTKYNYRWGIPDARYNSYDELIPKHGYLPPRPENLHSYNYLSVPIGVRYLIGKRWIVCGGVRVLKLLSEYSYLKLYHQDGKVESYSNKKTFNKEGLSPWALNLTAEVGYTLPVLKYNITWKAAFEYAVTDYISNKYPALNLYPYTFSVGASFPLVKF